MSRALKAAQKASSTGGGADAAGSVGSSSLPRPRCSAALTAPTVVDSISAISSSEKSNASFRTRAARSCGARRATSDPAASRAARRSGVALGSGAAAAYSRLRLTRLIHWFDATRNSQARGFAGASFTPARVTEARASASWTRSSASHGLRVRQRQYRKRSPRKGSYSSRKRRQGRWTPQAVMKSGSDEDLSISFMWNGQSRAAKGYVSGPTLTSRGPAHTLSADARVGRVPSAGRDFPTYHRSHRLV